MQEACQVLLAAAGYEQYEVSAYARADHQCRHNVNYWRFGDYLGIGAGAHGKLTGDNGVVRTIRQKQPRQYLSLGAAERVECTAVPEHTLAFEFMLNALRLRAGFQLEQFERVTRLPSHTIARQLDEACSKGLLQKESAHWIVTDFGRRFLNDLQALFLPIEPLVEALQVRELTHKFVASGAFRTTVARVLYTRKSWLPECVYRVT